MACFTPIFMQEHADIGDMSVSLVLPVLQPNDTSVWEHTLFFEVIARLDPQDIVEIAQAEVAGAARLEHSKHADQGCLDVRIVKQIVERHTSQHAVEYRREVPRQVAHIGDTNI